MTLNVDIAYLTDIYIGIRRRTLYIKRLREKGFVIFFFNNITITYVPNYIYVCVLSQKFNYVLSRLNFVGGVEYSSPETPTLVLL